MVDDPKPHPDENDAKARIILANMAIRDAEAEANSGWLAPAFELALIAWRKAEAAERAAIGMPPELVLAAQKTKSAARASLLRAARLGAYVHGGLAYDPEDDVPEFALSAMQAEAARIRKSAPAPMAWTKPNPCPKPAKKPPEKRTPAPKRKVTYRRSAGKTAAKP